MPTYVMGYDAPDNKIYTALGITKERSEAMEDKVLEILTGERSKISDDLVSIGEYCDDMNELAYMSYLLGCQIGKANADPLGMIIRHALKRFQKDLKEGKI